MKQIIECVLNVSEGRDFQKIRRIAASIEKAPEAALLDFCFDPDHHRSVFTFIGDSVAIREAADAVVCEAVSSIDLRVHRGVHPRIGAADVVPFVPIQNVSMEECVALARAFGADLAERLRLPVFLYERAALKTERQGLLAIRRGGFERLARKMETDPPDFGPGRPHATAGATVVGARSLLIAFNVVLDTADVRIARAVAARLRESGGGLPGVRALGFSLGTKGLSQVSMNLTDFRKTRPVEAFRRVASLARGVHGTEAVASELIGLIPQDALEPGDTDAMKLQEFSPNRILEVRIEEALRE